MVFVALVGCGTVLSTSQVSSIFSIFLRLLKAVIAPSLRACCPLSEHSKQEQEEEEEDDDDEDLFRASTNYKETKHPSLSEQRTKMAEGFGSAS